MSWMKDMFGTERPVIALLHLLAMPTDPKYDRDGGVEKVVARAERELTALQNGGVDGILICNEFSIPYVHNVETVTVATMAYLIGTLKNRFTVPFGVHVAHDKYKAFDLAAATGAAFVRGPFSGANAGDYGIVSYEPGEVQRHRMHVCADNVRIFTSLVPEGSRPLAPRSYGEMAVTNDFNLAPDVYMVAAETAGRPADLDLIAEIRKYTKTPVFCNNGVNADNVASVLAAADGCVVGTSLKYDGKFMNEVDEARAVRLMEAARAFRGDL